MNGRVLGAAAVSARDVHRDGGGAAPDLAGLFCDPDSLEPLHPVRDGSVVRLCSTSGRSFAVRDGIAILLDPAHVTGPNAHQQRVFDWLAPVYDLGSTLHACASRAAQSWRDEYLSELGVQPGARVLEVSVGTGANLERLPHHGSYVGLDLSWGMLRRCRRKQRRGCFDVTLCQALAERLPFPSATFDLVFHIGAVNFFTDQRRALAEMARVARPGARIVVVDASETFARKYDRIPVIGSIYARRAAPLGAPVAHLPATVSIVDVREIAQGELYRLVLQKGLTRA